MRIKNFGNTGISSMDFAAGDRQAALRAMQRSRLRRAPGGSSGRGMDGAGKDKRSVRAWLHGKRSLRVTWWNFYSRMYMAVVPGADLERAMYSFHRMHHAVTLGWLSYLVSVVEMAADIKQRGLLAAARTTAAPGSDAHR